MGWRGGSLTARASCAAYFSPSSAPARSASPAPNERTRRGSSSRRLGCRSPRSLSRRVSQACDSSTIPCARSSRSRPARCGGGRRRGRPGAEDARSTPRFTTVTLRLPFRPPLDAAGLLGFFGGRTVPSLEEVEGATYRRTLRLAHGPGVVELTPGDGHIAGVLHLADLRDLAVAVNRCRALFDLDADPQAVDAALASDPLLARLVRRAPGKRVPGAADGAEIAVRAVLGQQVSVASARRTAARIVESLGEPLAQPLGSLTSLFPSPEALAEADPALLPMPAARAATIQALARRARPA